MFAPAAPAALGRWCLPVVGGRGSGLGNELGAWARAYLMSREIGAACLAPAFGRNERGYSRHFGTARLDWLGHQLLLRGLPSVRFEEADYLAHGGGDVAQAFAAFADARQLRRRAPLVVATSGMWGGVFHAERALEFIRATLYGTRYARSNLAELAARRDPACLTVAMHVRLGDFATGQAAPEAYQHRFNISLPLAWFIGIGRQLRQALGRSVQFQVFSDGTPEQLAPLTQVINPLNTASAAPADVSDLLALSQADLLVCSVSSYSMWAAALSDAPYLWFKPQLHRHDDGALSIWGHEPGQQAAGSPTRLALETPSGLAQHAADRRAYAVSVDEAMPDALLNTLAARHRQRSRTGDLVRFGVLAATPAPHANLAGSAA
jgi:hypothetical protein